MIVSDLSDPTVSTEELFLIFYCIIDDLYPEAAPDWVRFRNGADRMAMTDSEIITLSIMQEGQLQDFLQRLRAELPSGDQEGLPPPVSGSD